MTEPSVSSTLADRAEGTLIGAAVGDALGVPYEFECRPRLAPGEQAEMSGGGLGDFAPGEWSDDTSMTNAIARVAREGLDLHSDDALDAIAIGFLEWFKGSPPDVGNQTRAVLSDTRQRLHTDPGARPAVVMSSAAQEYAAGSSHSAGNGALMRTAPVALSHLTDRTGCAHAARRIASLTHDDVLAGDSCVLWSEAIRIAVTEEVFDVDSGLDLLPTERRDQWARWLKEAGYDDPNRFSPNGFTITALQAALSSIQYTPVPLEHPSRHLADALHTSIRIGNDTDTVAAIAGALLGARWGSSAIPTKWSEAIHGWPTTITGAPSTAEDLRTWAARALR